MITFTFPSEYLLYAFYAIFYTLGAIFIVLGFVDKNETNKMVCFMSASIFIVVTTAAIIADLHLFEVVLT